MKQYTTAVVYIAQRDSLFRCHNCVPCRIRVLLIAATQWCAAVNGYHTLARVALLSSQFTTLASVVLVVPSPRR